MPAPSLCVVSGVVYDENGAPAVGVTLYLKRVLLNGVLIGTAPIGTASIPQLAGGDHTIQYIEAITSIAGGVVSFTVPQLSTVYLEGNVSGYNNGEVALSIPATATATLEALTPATFPIDVTSFTFLSLVDTPDDFVGDALKWARVNAGETALEFFAPTGTPNGTKFLRDDLSWQSAGSIITAEEIQDALVNFFPDVAPFDWTYDDAGDRVTLAILDATTSARGLMSTAYATRLDQLEVGDAPTFAGLTLSGLTAGSIPFAGTGGLISQDNAALLFDSSGRRVQVGRASGGTQTLIGETSSASYAGIWFGTAAPTLTNYSFLGNQTEINFNVPTTGSMWFNIGNANKLKIDSTGVVGINKSSSIAAQLHTLSNAIGVIPLIAEGPAGQTASLFEARVNGVVKTYIDKDGFIKFTTDNTVDIGASGATRPRSIYVGTLGVFGGTVSAAAIASAGNINTAATAAIYWTGRVVCRSPADGVLTLSNQAETDFSRLQFGGTTSSFPSLKRSATIVQGKLADDSDFCPVQGKLRSHANVTAETPTATHTLRLFDAAGTEYKVLCVAA